MGKLVEAKIKWNDTKEIEVMTICIGKLPNGVNDDEIFFYAENNEEFKSLCKPKNGNDFFITSFRDAGRTRKQVTVKVTTMVTMMVDVIDSVDTDEAVEHLVSQMDYHFDMCDSVEEGDDIYGEVIETEIIEGTAVTETEIW